MLGAYRAGRTLLVPAQELRIAGEVAGQQGHLLGVRRTGCRREPATRPERQSAQPLGTVPRQPGEA